MHIFEFQSRIATETNNKLSLLFEKPKKNNVIIIYRVSIISELHTINIYFSYVNTDIIFPFYMSHTQGYTFFLFLLSFYPLLYFISFDISIGFKNV